MKQSFLGEPEVMITVTIGYKMINVFLLPFISLLLGRDDDCSKKISKNIHFHIRLRNIVQYTTHENP